jgi:ABC-type Zn2+ transport system substrate-binding protein/surface adhesin
MMKKNNLTAGCEHHHYITKSEVHNHHHHHKKNMFLFLIIETGLLTTTLSIPTMIISAQAYPSGSMPVSNNSTSSINQSTQMGICVVGAKSPCNGDSNSPK